MKVLFVTSKEDDYLASTLWDGLQEILGEENVFDIAWSPSLHRGMGGDNPCSRISNTRGNGQCPYNGFDLMVLNAFFERDGHDWHYPINLKATYLKPQGKVVYVDGFDDCHTWKPPRMPVDRVFKLEIDPCFNYHMNVLPMHFGVPSRWFDDDGGKHDRVYDVLCTHTHQANQVRWDVMQRIWQTKHKHLSITASGSLTDPKTYDTYLRRSKLMICPPGAGSDCMKQWEAMAAGCIPIFVGHPARVRDPDWFQHVFTASVENLPDVIDQALSMDLRPMRDNLRAYALANHTTRARAQRLLTLAGL